MKLKTLVTVLMICMLLMMVAAPAFACTGYDPCPDGAYGNGDTGIDIVGWVQIWIDIFGGWW